MLLEGKISDRFNYRKIANWFLVLGHGSIVLNTLEFHCI